MAAQHTDAIRIYWRNEYFKHLPLNKIFGSDSSNHQRALETIGKFISQTFQLAQSSNIGNKFALFAKINNDYGLVETLEDLVYYLEHTRDFLVCESTADLKKCIIPLYERSKINLEKVTHQLSNVQQSVYSETSEAEEAAKNLENNQSLQKENSVAIEPSIVSHNQVPQQAQQNTNPTSQDNQQPSYVQAQNLSQSNNQMMKNMESTGSYNNTSKQDSNQVQIKPPVEQSNPQPTHPSPTNHQQVPQGFANHPNQQHPPFIPQMQQSQGHMSQQMQNIPSQFSNAPMGNNLPPSMEELQNQSMRSMPKMQSQQNQPHSAPLMASVTENYSLPKQPTNQPPSQGSIPEFQMLKNPAEFAPPHPSQFNLPPSANDVQKMSMNTQFTQPEASNFFQGGQSNFGHY